MVLTQNALVLTTGELDALETDTYTDRKGIDLCGSSFCRSTTSITKLVEKGLIGDENNEFHQKKSPVPLCADDMPQFNHFDRETPLIKLGEKQYTMSKRTKTKIRQKILTWSRVERKRDVKFVFVTLTLTSKQIGTDKDYSKMLNTYFTYLRKYFGFKNYLYVNERQQNGNIHTHMICDQFLPIRRINYMWCKVLADNGYNKQGDPIYMWANGRHKDAGSNPVDISCIYDVKALTYYVTKYVTKNDTSFDCLIWNCSNTISRLFTSCKIWDKTTFSLLFPHVRNVLKAELTDGSSLYIHLLSLYHSIQKKHFKINESVLAGTIDREIYINNLKAICN